MTHPIESSTVRILRQDGKTVGTGFLVATDLVVTCAHVILKGTLAYAGDQVKLQFTGRKEIISAEVLSQYWRDDKNVDVAFLRLEQVPDGIPWLSLGLAEHSSQGNIFRSFGYTTAAGINGIFINGTFDGYKSEDLIIQLQSPQAYNGSSGAPVFDEKRGVVVGMIIGGHTSSGRNALTTKAIPTELLFDICAEIRPSKTSPYIGLEAFSAETSQFFFGRESLKKKLLKVLKEECRFLAVFGPSGSGKSSVIRAGLLPDLKNGKLAGSQDWGQIIMRPAEYPKAQIQAAKPEEIENISEYLLTGPGKERVILFVDQFEELFTDLEDNKRESFVKDLATVLDNPQFILVLSMRDEFLSSFNSEISALSKLDDMRIVLVPPTLEEDDVKAIIEEPAKAVGLKLADGLTERILQDLRGDGEAKSSSLPLLEFVLAKLWEYRRYGILTREDYENLGGVTGSLARWAEDTYNELSREPELQVSTESLLTSLVHPGNEELDWPDTLWRRRLAEFADPKIQVVIKKFVERRLIITSRKTEGPIYNERPIETGGEMIELVHYALVREWGRLKGWVKKNREKTRILETVEDAARAWKAAPMNPDLYLHRGGRLEDALKLQDSLSPEAKTYLAACKINEQRLRRNIIAGVAMAVLSVMIVLAGWAFTSNKNAVELGYQVATAEAAKATAVGESIIRATAQADAETQKIEAEHQATIARAGELVAASISQLQADPGLSLLLAVEASNKVNDTQTEEALRQAFLGYRQVAEISAHHQPVYDAVYSPDGKYYVTVGWDKTARIWDAGTNQQVGLPLMHDNYVVRAAISTVCPDGQRYLITASQQDGKVWVWNLANGKLINTFTNPLGIVVKLYGVAVSPNCKYIAASGSKGLVLLGEFPGRNITFDLAGNKAVNTVRFSPDSTRLLTAGADNVARILVFDQSSELNISQQKEFLHDGEVTWADFSPDGKTILTASKDKTARRWDANTGQVLQEYIGHTNWVFSAEYSPDGIYVITAGSDGTVRIWSTLSGIQVAELRGHKGVVYSAVYSPDGKYILTSSEDKTARIWKAPQSLAQFAGNTNWAREANFSPDGRLVVSAGWDQTARIWDTTTQELLATLDHSDRVNSASFSQSGRLLVTASRDAIATIWDVSNPRKPQKLREFSGHFTLVNTARFSPNDKYIVTASQDNTARIWDAASGKLLSIFQGPDTQIEVNYASFSPDGTRIVTAGGDGIARVWQVDVNQPVIIAPIMELKGHTQSLESAAYSHNGKYIVTSGDYTSRIWNADSGEIKTIIGGYNDMVFDASFDTNDQFLVTASGDFRAVIWDVNSGNRLTEFGDHAGPVMSAVFSSDGNTILTASQDGVVRLFANDLGGTVVEMVAQAKTRIPRDFTCQERNQYLKENISCPTP